jgi:hypothetical protein
MKGAALLITAALAGCASTVTPTTELQAPVVVSNPALLRPSANAGEVLIKRDRGMQGGGCNHQLLLDGAPFAELRPGEGVTIYPAAGDHILGMAPARGLCNGSTPEIAIHVVRGARLTFRTSVEQSMDVTIKPTAF